MMTDSTRYEALDAIVPESLADKAARLEAEQAADLEHADLETLADTAAAVLDRRVEQLEAELDHRDAEITRLREQKDRSNESARKALEQRQEMAAERYEWQERGTRVEAEIARLRADLDMLRVGAQGMADQLAGKGARLNANGLRELGEARTEVRRLVVELAEARLDVKGAQQGRNEAEQRAVTAEAALVRVHGVCARLAPSVPGAIVEAVAHSTGWNDALDAVSTALNAKET